MTVALVLAGSRGEADAGQQKQLCGQLAALGVRRVDAAERTGPGLLTVAAAARRPGNACSSASARTPCPSRCWPAAWRHRHRGLHRVTAGTVPAVPACRRGPALPGSRWRARRWSSTRPTWTRWPWRPRRWRPAFRARAGQRAGRRAHPPRHHGPDPRCRAGQRGRRRPAGRPRRPRHGPLGRVAPARPGRALRDLARPRAGRRGVVRRAGGAGQAAGHRGAGGLVPGRQGRRCSPPPARTGGSGPS